MLNLRHCILVSSFAPTFDSLVVHCGPLCCVSSAKLGVAVYVSPFSGRVVLRLNLCYPVGDLGHRVRREIWKKSFMV